MSNEFGNKLKKIRKEQKITQGEIAKALNTTKATISRWESGKQEPSITLLKMLASFLSVSIDDLTDFDIYDYSFEYEHNGTKLIHKENKKRNSHE